MVGRKIEDRRGKEGKNYLAKKWGRKGRKYWQKNEGQKNKF